MKAHGTAMRGHETFSLLPVWETAKKRAQAAFTPTSLRMAAAAVIALFLFGLTIWGFCQAIDELNQMHLPPYGTMWVF